MGQELPEGYPRIPKNSGGGAATPEDLARLQEEALNNWTARAARLSAERGQPVSVAEAQAEYRATIHEVFDKSK